MLHVTALWYLGISLICPHIFLSQNCYNSTCLYSSNIGEILLYNSQLVVITYELIYIVQAAHRKGGNHCVTALFARNNLVSTPIGSNLWRSVVIWVLYFASRYLISNLLVTKIHLRIEEPRVIVDSGNGLAPTRACSGDFLSCGSF